MAKKRVRLTDENDPLNSTDRVLAGFEQVSKITSQQDNKSASQEDNFSISQPVSKITSQQDNKLASQEDNFSISQPVSKITSQQDNKSASQEDNFSTSQSVNKPKLRKSTFQISEEILNKLEQLHLRLQLQLGKKDSPYKEVIVEEAIVQLLKQMNSSPTGLLEALSKRQTERGN